MPGHIETVLKQKFRDATQAIVDHYFVVLADTQDRGMALKMANAMFEVKAKELNLMRWEARILAEQAMIAIKERAH